MEIVSVEKRNCNLDLLRIMACIGVVGLHTLQKAISVVNSTLYYLCGFAVPIFFMISGYVLLNREEVTFSYSARKIVSILKLVLIWNLIFAVIKIGAGIIFRNWSFGLLINIAMEFPKGFLQFGMFWHFWYFGALIIIYAFLPILHKMCKDTIRMHVIWVVLVLVCIGIQCTSYVIHQPIQKYIRQTFRLWSWLQFFLFGGVICRIGKKYYQRWAVLRAL